MGNDHDKSLQHSSNIIADSIAFAPGSTYSSKTEYYQDMKSPRYKSDLQFRANADAKMLRTIEQHGGQVEGCSVAAPDGGFMRAVATHRADGSVDSGLTSLDAPTGRSPEPGEQHPNRIAGGGGLPVLETLPGGAMRATYRSTDSVPKDTSKPATNRHNVKGKV
jgi:hypothetical protein